LRQVEGLVKVLPRHADKQFQGLNFGVLAVNGGLLVSRLAVALQFMDPP
jgi:hypothetical protein